MARSIQYIAVHCTATSTATTIRTLEAIFKGRGFKRPGYHYVIAYDGSIHQMLDEEYVSNGVKGFNLSTINVAYIGGVERQEGRLVGVDTRSEAQKESLETLLTELKGRYPEAIIKGHRDFSPDLNGNGIIDPWERIKECPCFDAMAEYAHLNNK